MKIPSPRLRLSLPLSFLAAVLTTGGITLLALWCQPNSFRALLSGFLRQPLLIVLNALPIGLLVLAAAFLFRNVFFGAALVNFLAGALSVANRVKIEVRDEPVFPRDFALLKEVGSALGTYDIRFPVPQIAAMVLVSLALTALGFFIACEPFPVEKLRGWPGRALGAAASLALLTGLILTVYASKDLYQSFKVRNAEYVPSVFNDLGFPYAFCRHFTTYLVDRPEGFSRAMAENWETGDRPGQGKPVSVVMVMNEAFSDLTDEDVFTYDEERDPLPSLHALRQDPHALCGHVVVPGFAGGTANTEFDVLTGMQTNALSASTTSAMRVVNRNLDSLFRVFAADGYETSFYHPGDNWFYNRENVYRWLGAGKTRFIGDMEAPEYKGRWVTDGYAAGLIEDAFEQAEAPLFHFTTTIQNHMSYTADKYGPDYDFPPVETSVPPSEEAETLLKVYIEGVRDADAMLGRLRRYFAAQDEPVILVYWGDHLPYLGDNMLAYRELGLDAAAPEGDQRDPLSPYKAPYVIWANDAAADVLDWESAAESLALPESVSAAFLGAAVLELTGRGEESPWFSFLNQLRRELPVVQRSVCQLSDGSVTEEFTGEQRDLLQKWRRWSYYKLQYKEIRNPA